MFKLTQRQIDHLKAFWPNHNLRIRSDLTVLGRRKDEPDKPYEVLSEPDQTVEHLKAVNLSVDWHRPKNWK